MKYAFPRNINLNHFYQNIKIHIQKSWQGIEAKKTKMQKVTVEGADLAKEIAVKVNEDFNEKQLPLMLAMINAIVEDKKLELNWEAFR